MPIVDHQINHLIVVHWGLVGSNSSGNPAYRSQNPWQALEHYMEGQRGNAAQFFQANGATCQRIDRGGTVWRVTLAAVPTPAELDVDEFAHQLLANLVANFTPQPGDQIFVSFASAAGLGHVEWMP